MHHHAQNSYCWFNVISLLVLLLKAIKLERHKNPNVPGISCLAFPSLAHDPIPTIPKTYGVQASIHSYITTCVIKTITLGFLLKFPSGLCARVWPGIPAPFPALHTAPPPGLLHLAHCGPAAAHTTAHVDARGAATHDGEGERGDPGGPAEPEEGG